MPMGLGLYTAVSSRVVPGTGAPGCTGVRLCAVGRRTHVLGARSIPHPVSSRLSVSSRQRLELRVSPPSATRILPSGLSPSVPGFHRLSRRIHGRFRRVWCERVADYDRRFGLSPTPEHVAGGKNTTQPSHAVPGTSSWLSALVGCHSERGSSWSPSAEQCPTASATARRRCSGPRLRDVSNASEGSEIWMMHWAPRSLRRC